MSDGVHSQHRGGQNPSRDTEWSTVVGHTFGNRLGQLRWLPHGSVEVGVYGLYYGDTPFSH